MRRSPADRFWSKVDKSGDCWIWTGNIMGAGYGQIWIERKPVYAHRFSYELERGPIPEGLQIDHLCRNRACVRPTHLEAVTVRENLLRGLTIAARNAKATHCPSGHPYDESNTHIGRRNERVCRACKRQRARTAA